MNTFGRRTFLESSARAAATATLCHALRPLAAGFNGGQPRPARPYEVLVLGDSVMWGQGLREEHKFYTKVKEALEGEILCREVRIHVLAHSEATILPKRKFCPDAPGEVPMRTPSIYAQIEWAVADYERMGVGREAVGLIVVDGGINDVVTPRIINFLTPDSYVIRGARKFCGEAMQDMLKLILKTFPNALVVVPGYFPIISEQTDRNTVRDLVRAFFGIEEGNKNLAMADVEMGAWGPDWFFKRLADLSTLWYRESDKNLRWAVDEANAAAAKGTSGAMPRAFFAPVSFSPDECYAAPNSCLWRVSGSAPGGGLMSNDEMFDERQPRCVAHERDPIRLVVCRIAGTGHPNLKGEAKYTEAILSRLRAQLGRSACAKAT